MKKFNLNKIQKEAVESVDKPVLIFAGAGTGKTRVLTHKIAFLIDKKGYNPDEVLAVTFTNKAAQEMKKRVKLIIDENHSIPNIGTFHSICAKFLREEINSIGFNSNFAIYDISDQDMLIKSIINSNKMATNGVTVPSFRSKISYYKSRLVNPISFLEKSNNPFDNCLAQIFPIYMKELKENNALDFSDLLLLPLEIFKNNSNILTKYQKKFKYILVDEYQDTNEPQFHFIKYLSEQHNQITVVGDDDQSIYGWRGADISNILNFEKTFPECKIFKLEQNYRSSGNILSVAGNVVENNIVRSKKTLWTEKSNGDKIGIMETFDELEEIDGVIELVQKEIHQNKRSFSDFVILYRTNAQSRAIEDGLRRKAISYEIVGGIKFYERKEIKDLLAYLRVLVNPIDTISLKRIMNFPPRGIGAKTIEKCELLGLKKNIPMLQVLETPEEMNLKGQQAAGLVQFYGIIKKYSELKDKLDASELASVLVDELGLIKLYNDQNTEDAKERVENIQELLTTIHQFCEKKTNSTINEFLEEVSLLTSIDSWNDSTNHITLMTIHSAKGLEFPIVFITGLEDGLFPLSNSFDEPKKLEEERRLFYVAVTRAEEKAFLHYATNRRRSSGSSGLGQPSRFINEIPNDLIERLNFQSALTRRLVKEKNSDKYKLKYIRTITSFNEFERGDKVEHPIFGKGMILAVDGSGDNQKITVVFQGNIEKRLIGKYANLKHIK